ncbi:MAG TPA: GlsB/YeaQ/YmgE family stress response membrane protein [Candidatus Limnocylindrales bacterium]|nr:GlsB/YeaQ/YmgE family stress response membrane protein [Candidatus Limnocylindrales bacterium]
MLELIWIVIIGAVVGALAKMLMPGDDPGGFFVTALIGIAGAAVATLLGRALGLYHADEAAGFIASIVGAILILFAYSRMRRSRA